MKHRDFFPTFSFVALWLSCSVLFLLLPDKACSQRSELGLFLGTSRYNGDIDQDWLNTDFLHPAIGLVYRYPLNYRIALKANAYYGTVSDADANASDAWQRNRNLSFTSPLLDIAAEVEFNFFQYKIGLAERMLTPYLFTGIGLFFFNPKDRIGSDWYALQPLGTEGQGTTVYHKRKYALTQFAIPVGMGVKTNLSKNCGLTLELGARKTYTDYLDDVSGAYPDPVILAAENGPAAAELSNRAIEKTDYTGRQRGNSKDKDWYLFGGVSIMFNLIPQQFRFGCRKAFHKV